MKKFILYAIIADPVTSDLSLVRLKTCDTREEAESGVNDWVKQYDVTILEVYQ